MTQPLNTLLEIAERERDEAAAALSQAEQAVRAQRQQWEQLSTYHAEYAARSPAAGGRAAPMDLLRCHGAFMERLQQALGHQQRVLDQAEHTVQQQRLQLLERETRLAAVRKLQERRAAAATQGAQRLEQRRADEAALQRHWHQQRATH